MKKFLMATALLGLSTIANATTVNLVNNHSFEDTIQANNTWSIYNSVTGWSSTNGIEIRNNVEGAAQDGKNYVELDANKNSAMQQTLSTVAGSQYLLSFYYSPRNGVNINSNNILASWNGTEIANITKSGAGNNGNVWELYSFLVTGTGSDVLKFAAGGVSDSYGGSLDNVSVNAVPVPAAAWLFASAVGLFGFSSRRKHV
jgi:hypothetical protein